MTKDDIFPHPHEDESAEDPFVGPADEYADQSFGGTPVDPIAAATNSRRRLAVFGILTGIAVFIVFFLFARSGGRNQQSQNAAIDGRIDSTVIAAPPTSSAPVEDPFAATPQTPTPYPTGEPNNFIDPSMFGDSYPTPDPYTTPYQPTPLAPPAYRSGTYPVPEGISSVPQYGARYPNSGPTWENPAVSPTGPGSKPSATPLSPEEIERQMELDLQREEAERRRAEREAALEAQRAEEARLRSQPTLVSENRDFLQMPSFLTPGVSRFRDPQEPIAAPSTRDELRDTGSFESGVTSEFDHLIIPGTRVHAVLVSEFISDVEGSSRVEARLSEPLRGRNGIILPAGTRAFGTVSAAPLTRGGQDPRVAITFDVFVTPDGRPIRGLRAQAVDPQTLALSVPAKADNRTLQRLWRGILSTGVDLALTANAQDRRTAFEMPSPRDEAINDIRRRAATIIGDPIGDESSIAPAVRLERGTRFMIIFGI